MLAGGTSIEARAADLARERLSALTLSQFPEYTIAPPPASALPRWLVACLRCVAPAPTAAPERLPETPIIYGKYQDEALYSPDSIEAELWPAASQMSYRMAEPSHVRMQSASTTVHARLHGMHAKRLHELEVKRKDHLDSLTSPDVRLTLRERADIDTRPFGTPRTVSSTGSLFGTPSNGRATPGASFGRAPRSSLLCEPNAVISNGIAAVAAIATPPPRKSSSGGGGGVSCRSGGSVPYPGDSSSPVGYVRSGDDWVHEHDVHRVIPGELYGPCGAMPFSPPSSPRDTCDGPMPVARQQKRLASAAPSSAAFANPLHEHYAATTTAARARYASEPMPGPGAYGATTSSFDAPVARMSAGTWSKDGRWKAEPPEHTIGPSPVHYTPRDNFCSSRMPASAPP